MYWMVRFLKLCDQVNKCHCLIYVFLDEAYVPKKLDKLYPHSMKCVFLWYTEGVKGYRLWLKRNMVIAYCSTRLWKFEWNELVLHDEVFDQKVENNVLNVNDLSEYQLVRDMLRYDSIRKPQHVDNYHMVSLMFNVWTVNNESYKEIHWNMNFFWIGLILCVKKWTFCVWAKFGLFSWFQMGVSRVLSKQRASIIYWEISPIVKIHHCI